ncbi:MAG: UDP-4-amino-4-deoxy-L-arabinose--oxoglutarate aminotransferase [Phycisphaerae bacterium]|nr:UDP-4-amino-4-deoxy-L-arabinose--oxoglutarate aminotransferase [Phycisphaerae bacterium]
METSQPQPAAATVPSATTTEAPVFVQTADAVQELDRWEQVGEEEARMVYEMTLRNELSGGTPVVRQFEAEWRRLTGLKFALTTVNGTSALYSALFGLGVGPGDEVICPDYTWICTVSPAPLLGAAPVFAESDPRTMMIDPDDIARRITPRTKAIIVVHLWGWVCDMDRIVAVARKAGVPVIEDCSHSHGATYRGKPVGSIGDVGCWSLQGTKPVSAGEGGVLATDDVDVFERACLVGQVNRIKGVDLVTTRYRDLQPLGTGMKFRAHPLGIGIASVQLAKLPELNRRRGAYVERIEAGLADVAALEPIPTSPGSQRGGFYGFPVRFRSERVGGASTADYIKACAGRGLKVGASVYPALHTLPYFAKGFDLFTGGRGPLVDGWRGYKPGDFPATRKLLTELLFLPVLSDPVDGAAEKILGILADASAAVSKL